MQCDICGFHYRKSDMRKRWDGVWACNKDWEIRNPQDFVRGIKEKINVPVARPDPVDITNETTLTADAAKGALTITVASVTDISDNDPVGIVLDDGTAFWTSANGEPAVLVVTIADELRGAASSGNTVYTKGDSSSSVLTDTSHL